MKHINTIRWVVTFVAVAILALWAVVAMHTEAGTPENACRGTTSVDIERTSTTPNTAKVEPATSARPTPDPYEIELIGRTIWGEAGGVSSKAERSAVAWCILNRADAWDKTIAETVTAPQQFQGYRPWGECPQEHLDLAEDVLTRWNAEKAGASNVGRTLPQNYLYFIGDGVRNYFTVEWQSSEYWDWSLPDPYKNQKGE